MDTLVVYLFICIDSLVINPKFENINNNKFDKLFEQADSCFNKEYKIDIEKIKKASEEAARSAFLKTYKDLLRKKEDR